MLFSEKNSNLCYYLSSPLDSRAVSEMRTKSMLCARVPVIASRQGEHHAGSGAYS